MQSPTSPDCGDHLNCGAPAATMPAPQRWRMPPRAEFRTRLKPVLPPPSPLNPPPPLQSPPRSGETVTSLFCQATSIARGLCSPFVTDTRSYIAFPLLRISHLCVFCDILSPKAVYRVLCPFFTPRMFSPGDRVWYHSCTLGAHVLVNVVRPSPYGPQQFKVCYILIPRNSLPHLWTPNNIRVTVNITRITLAQHQCKSRLTCVLFACIRLP